MHHPDASHPELSTFVPMSPFVRVLSHAGSAKSSALVAGLLYVGYTIMSLVGIGMIIPVMDIILDSSQQLNARPQVIQDVDSLHAWLAYGVTLGIKAYGPMGILWRICLAAMGIFVIKAVLRYGAMWQMATLRSQIAANLRSAIHRKVLKLSPGTMSDQRKGDILARASTDVTEIEWAVLTGLELLVREPLIILGSLAILLAMSVKLTLFILLVAPLSAWLLHVVGKKLKRKSSTAQSALGRVLASMESTLSGLNLIQAYQTETATQQQFSQINQSAMHATQAVHRKRDMASPISEVIGVGTLLMILLYGGSVVLTGQGMTGAALVGFVLFFYQLIPAFKAVTMAIYNVQKGSAAADRLFEILDLKETIQEPANALDWQSPKNGPEVIAWDNVTFTYPGADRPAIDQLSAEIRRGEIVALVGPSGGGKSTMMKLLVRSMDPDSGQVTMDGHPCRPSDKPSLRLAAIRSTYSLVSQDAVMFNESALENITLGDDNPDKQRAIESATKAQALGFIEAMPDGWDSLLGEGGNKLSGGQRQRIALARAIYRDAPVFLLDEATSALDAENEALVQVAMDQATENKTSVVIAHRLSTIHKADRILLIDKGQITESGNHETLMQRNGHYAMLVKTQTFAS